MQRLARLDASRDPKDRFGVSVAVLWTGGKDSALALHEFRERGVTELVTFVPPNAAFRAHDLGLMAWQARAVGLPHHQMIVEAPYEAGYRRALLALCALPLGTRDEILAGLVDHLACHSQQPSDRFRPADAERSAGRTGLEPATCGFGDRCSTN